ALLGVLAVFTEDQQADVIVIAVAQERQRADRDLDALQSLQPADKDEQASWPVADLAPRLAPVDGLEHREVDAGWDDKHALWVSPVRVDQLLAFVSRRRDQKVGLLSDLAFHADPQRGFRARPCR